MRRLRGACEGPTRRPQDGYETATYWLDSPPSIDDKTHLTYLKRVKPAFCLPSGCILRYFCAENADYGHSAVVLRPFCGHSVLGCDGFSGLTRFCSDAALILSVPCFSLRFLPQWCLATTVFAIYTVLIRYSSTINSVLTAL